MTRTWMPDAAVRIESGGVAFGSDDAALLRAVDTHGSLNAASTELERSFAHAQRRVVELEESFGSLLDRRRGGAGGGGSTLTQRARELLARYDRLCAEFAGVADVTLSVLSGTALERDGEFAHVEVEAGRLLALVPETVGAGDHVEVSVRADAVTIELPQQAAATDATSARNRFSGRIVSVDPGASVARVGVDVGDDTTLWALLTRDSLDRMSLAEGDDVVLSFKATATRAVARED